jgi:diguanylate cyclase (GGDEF)-like protein
MVRVIGEGGRRADWWRWFDVSPFRAVFTDLATMRASAGAFFVAFLWLHVPIVALVAFSNALGMRTILQIVGCMSVAAAIAHLTYRRDAASLATRLTIAASMTAAPALLVYAGQGAWQSDWHLYFFVVFAMLAAFIDWRPIALSAVLMALHHLILDLFFPSAVFSEPGLGRVMLHATIVAVECGTLFWMIRQTQALFFVSQRALAATQDALGECTQVQNALRQAVWHDHLTGLPNRAYFCERIAEKLAGIRDGDGGSFAILFLDCDRFKIINDTLGHAAGDAVLVAFVQRLRLCLGKNAMLARLGGDEFTILVDRSVTGSRDSAALAQRIVDELAQPFVIDDRRVFLTASIGIVENSIGSGPNHTSASLLQDADIAMYRAKSLGGNRFAYVSPEIHAAFARHSRLQSDLHRAFERGELRVSYQPIVALAMRETIGCEALLRWEHPLLGNIPPNEFIAIAEETGLIIEIGDFVLREACARASEWTLLPGISSAFTISVNVSVRQLTEVYFLDRVRSALDAASLPGRRLNLEITESMLMTASEPVTTVLDRLRRMSVGLHLDDFGTGYSSLAYLHEFPVQTLKIDRSFVSGRGDDVASPEIVRTILTLGSQLGLDVTAEGVETELQARHLRQMGCSNAQGYLFARPLERAAIPEFFARPIAV